MCNTSESTIGAVVGGPIGYMYGKGIEGARGAAEATERAAKEQQGLALSNAQMSPQQLALLDKQTSATLQNLDQQQQMLNSVDPALMELGHQTLAMLKGDKSIGAAGIYDKSRSEQETQLRAQLRQSLGAGYENTTSGQNALAQFQRQSSEGAYNAATSAIPTLASIYGQGLNNSMNYANQINNTYSNNTSAKVNAVNGTTSAVTGSAGSQYAGDIMMGNMAQGLISTGAQAGAKAYFGGKT